MQLTVWTRRLMSNGTYFPSNLLRPDEK